MRRYLPLFLASIACVTIAQAADHPVSMWQITGISNRIYLLGSIHMLRERDYPIPTVIEQAYQDADVLIMEVDTDDLDPIDMASLVNELGMIKDGSSLQAMMGPRLYAEASEYAANLEIPIDMLARTEPWLAAVTVEQMMLLRIGFNPEFGIELYLTQKANQDHKEILGFETAREQLEFLDGLSLSAQRSLLIETFRESINIEAQLEPLIDAWRSGDTAVIEKTLLSEMQEYPELYKTLIIDRNKAWVERIKGLIQQDNDYLVVIGVLHVVGADGVPALLSESGIEVDQLQEAGN